MKKIFIILVVSIFVVSCGQKNENTTNTGTTGTGVENNLNNNENNMSTTKKLENGDVVAFMKTTKGQIEIFLETKKAPITTANFIGLAKKGYYDGIVFHRIIKDFMIQGGDPTGTGAGGESIYGEKFKDEFDKDLKNNNLTLSMANAGANTNGSQFFINVADNNYLDFKHSVFGEVISGKENVLNISKVKTDSNDKPEKEVKIISIEIKEYKDGKFIDYSFDEKKAVSDYKKAEEEKKTSAVNSGDIVSVHYFGTLENGEKFDSSYDRGEPIDFTVGSGMMIAGFDKAVLGMKIGEKKSITLKPEEAYGVYDETKVQSIAREELKSFEEAGIKIEKGAKLPTQYGEFEIIEANQKEVKVDLNHTLAGKTLKFDIELVDKK